MKKFFKLSVTIIICISILSFSWTMFSQTENVNVYDKLKPFFESLYYVEKEFYEKDKIDYERIVDQSVRGMLSGLDDQFSYYLTPEDVNESDIEQDAKYGGIGTNVTYDAFYKVIRVVSPMYGSPAYKAGIKADDLIMTIDGSPVEDMAYMESVNKLRGDPGTLVKLEIGREGVGVLEFTVEREEIKLVMVQYSVTEYAGKKIGYVRINKFFGNTSSELRDKLNILYANDVDGIILDLRNNPGGYLTQAILVASMFIDSGEVIVTTRSSDGFVNTYRSIGNEFETLPMVTLVNKGSASSSEILSGALKDYGISPLVGDKTFGKAAVQTLFPLSNGGELWLTTAHYFTPNGNDIHMKGIEPDIVVEAEKIDETSEEIDKNTTMENIIINPEKDNQLKTALDLLTEGI